MAKRSTVTGGKAVVKALRHVVPGLAVPLNEASRKALAPMLSTARANAPRRTGALAKSLAIKRAKSAKARPVHLVGPRKDYVGPSGEKPVRYAHLAEFGSVPRFNGKRMDRGTPPQPFLTPAFEATKNLVLEIFGREIGPAIERRIKKLAKK